MATKKMTGNRKTAKGTKKSSAKTTRSNGSVNGTQSSHLMKLFEHGLKDIYWAEKALTKAIPKMIKNASSEDLIDALQNHLEETEEQVKKVEEVFQLIGKKATAKKCEGMHGIIKEGEEVMKECEDGEMCDAGIISAAQKVEHYEIAAYGTLRQFAETLGLNDAEELLREILDEEKAADEKLTEVAVSAVNMEAEEAA
jgi:ferritin-like metal-binding protein YciE